MARPPGTTDPPVIRRLHLAPHRFSFFQAVRLLEAARPEAAPIGTTGPARAEALRLRPHAGFDFPPSDLVAIRDLEGKGGVAGRTEITTAFFGLYGADSPLPAYFTEAILWNDESSRRRAFLDLFHHRLLSLLYRAWLKPRYPLQFRSGGADHLSQLLLGLVGLATPGSGEAAGLPPIHLLHFAGLLGHHLHSATALAHLLTDELDGAPVRVKECGLRWVVIAPPEQCRLGAPVARLGEGTVVGSRVPDRATLFTVAIGPLGYDDFVALLPGGKRLATCLALIHLFRTDPLAFAVDLHLSHAEVPPLRLGATDPEPRLGWTTWLGRPAGDGVVGVASEGV